MKIAFPVKENNGLESIVDEHFGVAQTFLIVDLETRKLELKDNRKLLAEGSKCKIGVFKKKDQVDAVVTRCMGDGSQRSLTASNIKVFQAQKETILENLELLEKDELKLFHIFDFCQIKKNKKEGGCGHHH
ncbi:MAG: dinitrogenase iron-molybdenum cofactor [Desulfobacula sp.]|uniref:NifB/NifX family molybdenum-iron cluster-binding protein n=1 Tax=Desulfobacula sp. TaxID=2593537 RepID=UPI0025B9DA80|nr:NifB/NifX family molybdenum-iron cluster-binding protein [Desulfobacula sp.]MCD4721794.1 dinitrogenase iron-molybdenum cofactor [Desulfobacula sp.]